MDFKLLITRPLIGVGGNQDILLIAKPERATHLAIKDYTSSVVEKRIVVRNNEPVFL